MARSVPLQVARSSCLPPERCSARPYDCDQRCCVGDVVQPVALSPAGYLGVPDKPAVGQPVDVAPFGTIRAWTGAAALPFGREHLRPGTENPTDWREHDLQPDDGNFGWLPLPGYGSTPANIGIEWAEPRDVYAVIVQYR